MNSCKRLRAFAVYAGVSVLALSAGMAEAQDRGAAVEQTSPEPAQARPGSVSEVVVTAAPREEVRARVQQRAAPNIVNIQSAETIAKYPDFNAAESLGRIPGVSLSSDTGEGRFVTIRGIDANLDGATYGGVVLLNTNAGGTYFSGGGRAVEFDTIPTGAIDGIVVTKTRLPDSDAEGLGGSIELTPRSAKNTLRPFADVTLGYGYEPLHDHGGPFNADIALGGRFGFPDGHFRLQNGAEVAPSTSGWISNPTPFSVVLTASTRQDRRAIDDIEESYIDDQAGGAPDKAVGQYDLRRYDYHRRRFGYGGEFDFTPNDNHSYYVRAAVAGYIESVHKNFLLFRNLDAVYGDTGAVPSDAANSKAFLVTTTPRISLTDEEETHRNQIYAVGGRDQFGDLLLDYRVAYSRATYQVSRNIGANFDDRTPVGISYDNITNPDRPVFRVTDGTNLNNPALYTLTGVSDSRENDRDEEWSYAANLQFPLRLINDSDRFKIGGSARLRGKVTNPFRESFQTVPSLSLANASSQAITNFYDDLFTNGPQIDRYAIRGLISSGAAISRLGEQLQSRGYFTADENIYAGYGQYTTTIGKLGVLAGVRVENTDALYGGNVASNSGTPVFQTRPQNYTDVFPSVQLRYDIAPKLIARATYSTGIGRPGFTQNTVATTVNDSTFSITRGNPALKPTTGDMFDLDLEYYLSNGGVVEIGLFDKEFDNYIVPRVQNGVFDPFGLPGQRYQVSTFLNVSGAYARGLEAAYHQKFTFLPGVLKGLGVEANATLVDSHILEYTAAQSLTGKNESGNLPGTSPVTLNLAGFYEAYGLQLRLAAEFVDRALFGLGGDKSLDTIEDSRLTLDFTSSYTLTPQVALYVNAKNLTDEPLRYYEGQPNRPIQREFYDRTYEAGVRARF